MPLPPRELHPNGRATWPVKYRRAAKYREQVAEIVGLKCRRNRHRWERALVRLDYHRKHKGTPSDPDNLIAWAKTAIDGIQDARVLADDRHLIYLPPRESFGSKNPRLLIRLTPV